MEPTLKIPIVKLIENIVWTAPIFQWRWKMILKASKFKRIRKQLPKQKRKYRKLS
jgi:hypothetical protein